MEPIRYAPKPVAVVVAWLGTAAALGWAVLATEPAARVLAVAATALLGVLAVLGTAVRPRLTADDNGVHLGALRGAGHWPWSAVRRVQVVTNRRLWRQPGVLELDLDDGVHERLVVLTALDLGADPYDVAQALDRVRTRGGR